MAIQFHVNGTAVISVQGPASFNSLATSTGIASASAAPNTLSKLGFSESGVDIDFNFQYQDCMADVYGPRVPVDVQYFLQDAIISFPLVMYEDSIFQDVLAQLPGLTAGTVAAAGHLILNGNNFFRLLVASTPVSAGLTPTPSPAEVCYNFPFCYPLSIKGRHGTQRKVYDMVWRALPAATSITGGSAVGAVLWNTTCS